MRASAGAFSSGSHEKSVTLQVRVLIVEDEVKMASLVRRGLVEEGYAVDVATTGEDALWMAEATRTTRSSST